MTEAEPQPKKAWWREHATHLVAGVAFLLVIGLWAGTWSWVGTWPTTERGIFGDMFGSVNALFSGLAFVGLIYAILLQRQELKLQREELKSTRNELQGSRKAQEAHNDFVKLQTFEGTFFQLVRSLNEVVDALEIRDGERVLLRGRSSFGFFKSQLWRTYSTALDSMGAGTFGVERAVAAYDAYYKSFGQQLGHYYRVLYNATKFVDQADVVNKKLYTNIVRALLSDDEVCLLFYNCLSPRGAKFKPLVEKYALLKMLHEEDVWKGVSRSHYNQAAFGQV